MASSFLQNVFAKFLMTFCNTLIPILVLPYVYRVLTPYSIGVIEYATSVCTYFTLLGMLGIYNYGLREISLNKHDSHKVSVIYSNLFIIGLCSNILCFVLYIGIATLFSFEVDTKLIMMILGVQLLGQIFYVEWFNEAYEDFGFITIKTVIIKLINAICIFLFITEDSDYIWYAWILVITLCVNYIVSFLYANRRIPYANISICWKDIKTYITPLLIILILNNTNVLYTLADKTFLGTFFDKASVAYYSLGQKITDAIRALVLSVILVSLPRLSSYIDRDKSVYIVKIKQLLRLVFLICVPVSMGLFLLSNEVIILFAGEEYLLAIPAFKIFVLRILVMGIEAVLYNNIIFLHRKEKILLIMNLICGVINVIMNIVLIDILTPELAIATTLLAECLFQTLCILYIRNKLHILINLFGFDHLKYVCLSVIFIPIIYIVRNYIHDTTWVLCISIIACSLYYITVLCAIKDDIISELYMRVRNILK